LLQPSTPFTTHEDYDNAIRLMIDKNASTVVSVGPVEPPSTKQGPIDEEGRLRRPLDIMEAGYYRRQNDPQEYALNGGMYLFKWEFFKQQQRVIGDPDRTYAYVMDRVHSVDIDEEIDLQWAAFLVERGYVDLAPWLKASLPAASPPGLNVPDRRETTPEVIHGKEWFQGPG